jgi:hypothetical protein
VSPGCTLAARRDLARTEAARGAQLLKNAQLPAISGNQLDRDAGRLRQCSLACVARMQPAARSFCGGDDQQLGRLGRAPS